MKSNLNHSSRHTVEQIQQRQAIAVLNKMGAHFLPEGSCKAWTHRATVDALS
jgi:hypothetical protein